MQMVNTVWTGEIEIRNEAVGSRWHLHPEVNDIGRATFWKGFQGLVFGENTRKWWSGRDKMAAWSRSVAVGIERGVI